MYFKKIQFLDGLNELLFSVSLPENEDVFLIFRKIPIYASVAKWALTTHKSYFPQPYLYWWLQWDIIGVTGVDFGGPQWNSENIMVFKKLMLS